MVRFSSSGRAVALIASAFLLCGVLHVALYGVFFTDSIAQLFCGAAVLVWALSVQRRVTDRRLRRTLLWAAAFLLLYSILQYVNYSLSGGAPDFSRYLWYAYYIPMIAVPLCCFFTALSVYWPEEEPLPRICVFLTVLAALMALGFLTNDLHFSAFSFPSGVLDGNGEERHSWLYVLYCIWFGLLMLAALVIISRKSRRSVGRTLQALPAAPVLAMSLLLLLGLMGIRPRVNGIDIWKDGQIFTFGVLGFLESCIGIGLIPANRDYEHLFSLAELPAVILDEREQPVYRTANARYPFPENADTRVQAHAIPGGSIRWTTDVGPLRMMNESLTEAIQQIEARNAYLAEENRTRQERAELETRSRLYDRVSHIVRPQLDSIEARARAAEGTEDFQAQLPRIAVLCAYVKRRSNMELMAADLLPLEELAAAIRESLENIRLGGADTALQAAGHGEYPARMITAAYEHFEDIAEASMDSLSGLLVTIRADGDRLTLRMLLQADAIEYAAKPHPEDAGFTRQLTVSTDNRDTLVTLTLAKGGGAA
ncbi:MAG: hypothetical protein IJI09_01905 [Clostridia bacterium]|nr:hypothetical protein [Clostridia bacterium]